MNMGTPLSGSTVKNHISFKTVFEHSAIRRTSCRSWFLVCIQLPQARLLQHPRLLQVRKLIIQITIQQSSEVTVWIDKHWEFTSETSEELLHEPTQIQKPKKKEDHEQNGETRIQTYQNGCKNSARILWMREFLNTETHTPVLLMDYL